MPSRRNHLPSNFLNTYRTGAADEVRYIPLSLGFLKLEYGTGTPGILSLISFILDANDDAIAIGSRLEMAIADDGGDEVTYISENGVSGLQWSRGAVIWGHTYDDDGPPSPGRTVALADWIDECVASMINPSQEEIDERRQLDRKES